MSKAREIADQNAITVDDYSVSQTPAPNKIPVADSNGKLNDWVDTSQLGDMTKSVYDTNNNGIVDKAESIDDGNNNTASATDILSAVNLKHQQNTDTGTTATEFYVDTTGNNVAVKAHIQNTNNPHNVTASQVELGNVTNDAQLKRAAGDINSFTEKTTPVSADIILVEDSADSYNKKKVQIGNLPSGSGGSSTFTGLSDTPADYTNQSGKVVAVKSTEDGLEFIDATTSSNYNIDGGNSLSNYVLNQSLDCGTSA